jgi:hypothetical protein
LDNTSIIGQDGEQAYDENMPQYQIVALHVRRITEESVGWRDKTSAMGRRETQMTEAQGRIRAGMRHSLPELPWKTGQSELDIAFPRADRQPGLFRLNRDASIAPKG